MMGSFPTSLYELTMIPAVQFCVSVYAYVFMFNIIRNFVYTFFLLIVFL